MKRITLAMLAVAAMMVAGPTAMAGDVPWTFEQRVETLEKKVAAIEAAAARAGLRIPAVTHAPLPAPTVTVAAFDSTYGAPTFAGDGTCSGGSCSNAAGSAFMGGRPRLFGRWR